MKRCAAYLFVLLTVLSAVFAAGCARSASSPAAYMMETTPAATAAWGGIADNKAMAPEAAYDAAFDEMEFESAYPEEAWEDEPEPMPTESPDADLPGFTDSKLIYTCDLTIQTTTFQDTVSAIHELITKYDGFIAAETQNDNDTAWYRSGYVKTSASLSEHMTIRIPAQHYNAFLDALEGNGKILSKNMYVENISRQYSETETTIKSLETQEERLLDMMAQCDTVEDMITVEARLSEVQNELKLYRNRLSGMDTDIAYSTIDMNIYEVLEYTPDQDPVKVQTFGDRLKNTLKETGRGFLSFLENFLFIIINLLPYLLILAAIALLILWLVRRGKKKNAGKKTKSVPEVRQEDTQKRSE